MRGMRWTLAVFVSAVTWACGEHGTGPDATVGPSFAAGGVGRPTVLVNSDAGGNGTATTIQEGIDMVGEGGRVMVLPGTYEEALIINKGVTLEVIAGEDGAVLIAPSTAPQAVLVSTEAPVVIRGLTVQGGPFGIRALNAAVNLTVERAWVRDFTTAGITVVWNAPASGTAARFVVRHNRVEGGAVRPSSGISTQGDVNGLIEGNIVRGTANRCINVAFGSAVPVGVPTTVDVVGNDLDRCGVASGINVTASNFQPTGTRMANVVGNTIRNSVADRTRNGIYFEGFTGRVEHNSIIAVVQATANPNPEAIAGCCMVVPAGIFVGSFRGATDATPIVRFNDVAGNAFAGIRVQQTTSVIATCNWWGSASGPSDAGPGSGDAAVGPAIVTPFATAPIAGTGATGC